MWKNIVELLGFLIQLIQQLNTVIAAVSLKKILITTIHNYQCEYNIDLDLEHKT